MGNSISNAEAKRLGLGHLVPAKATRGPNATGEFTEAAVIRACLDLLKLRGIDSWRQNTGAARMGKRLVRFGRPGASDIAGVIEGRSYIWEIHTDYFGGGWCPPRNLAVEAKRPASPGRPKGKLTVAQWDYLDTVRRTGGVALVVWSVDELASALDRLTADPSAVFELPPRPNERAKKGRKP